MANVQHAALTTVHRARYIQSTDPGAVGANVEWLDTNTTPPVAKKRNAGDTGWDIIEAGTSNIANLAVTTGKIADDAVTYAKLQNVSATARLLGRVAAGAGNAEEIPLGAGLAFSGGSLISTVSGPTVIKKSADQGPLTGTTLANVTDMSFSVSASSDYLFEFFVLFTTGVLSVGLVLAVTCPASPNVISYSAHIPNLEDANNAFWEGHGTSSGDAISGPNVPSSGPTYLAYIRGILRNGANSGSIQLQAANDTANNQVTVKQGTMCRHQLVS